MRGLRSLPGAFLGFAFLSGVGWLLDFLTFAVLLKLAGLPTFTANLVSSYVGVTFVWFASLRMLFGRAGHPGFLAGYWGYQFMSILVYSQILQLVADRLAAHDAWTVLPGLAAKVLVTPFNLLTNFVFMKLLTRAMPRKAHRGS